MSHYTLHNQTIYVLNGSSMEKNSLTQDYILRNKRTEYKICYIKIYVNLYKFGEIYINHNCIISSNM